jgi:hypothetical protein
MQQGTSERTESESQESNLSMITNDNDSNTNNENPSNSDLDLKGSETKGQIIQRHKREAKVQKIQFLSTLFLLLISTLIGITKQNCTNVTLCSKKR